MTQFVKSKAVSLKAHPEFNEKWLQGVIAEDPTLLGLGDLEVKEVERRQPRAGRLDMLLYDPETNTRYEVEIQLGATDETHIIRTLEYWDLEKSRYPQYEHVAVIVAEDITSRFLNVINLFNKAIPVVAVQMRALQVGETMTLSGTTVLDLFRLGTDEEDDAGQATNRDYWIGRGSKATVEVADDLLDLVQAVNPGMALKYNKHYIGLARDGVPDNFVTFRPRKEHLIAEFRIARSDEVTALIEAASVDTLAYDKRWNRYRVQLTKPDIEAHGELLVELVKRASGTASAVDE